MAEPAQEMWDEDARPVLPSLWQPLNLKGTQMKKETGTWLAQLDEHVTLDLRDREFEPYIGGRDYLNNF